MLHRKVAFLCLLNAESARFISLLSVSVAFYGTRPFLSIQVDKQPGNLAGHWALFAEDDVYEYKIWAALHGCYI